MFKSSSVLVAICLAPTIEVGIWAEQGRVESPEVAARLAEIRDSFLKSQQLPISNDESTRRTTVRTLIALAEAESSPQGNRRLAHLALNELGKYADQTDAVRFLVELIDFKESIVVNSNPLRRFTAARALLAVGLPARKPLLTVGRPLSEEKLQLRAFVLASLDITDDADSDSGRLIAISRVLREIERLDREPAPAGSEKGVEMAKKNLQYMVSLLADPRFFYKAIPHVETTRGKADARSQ